MRLFLLQLFVILNLLPLVATANPRCPSILRKVSYETQITGAQGSHFSLDVPDGKKMVKLQGASQLERESRIDIPPSHRAGIWKINWRKDTGYLTDLGAQYDNPSDLFGRLLQVCRKEAVRLVPLGMRETEYHQGQVLRQGARSGNLKPSELTTTVQAHRLLFPYAENYGMSFPDDIVTSYKVGGRLETGTYFDSADHALQRLGIALRLKQWRPIRRGFKAKPFAQSLFMKQMLKRDGVFQMRHEWQLELPPDADSSFAAKAAELFYRKILGIDLGKPLQVVETVMNTRLAAPLAFVEGARSDNIGFVTLDSYQRTQQPTPHVQFEVEIYPDSKNKIRFNRSRKQVERFIADLREWVYGSTLVFKPKYISAAPLTENSKYPSQRPSILYNQWYGIIWFVLKKGAETHAIPWISVPRYIKNGFRGQNPTVQIRGDTLFIRKNSRSQWVKIGTQTGREAIVPEYPLSSDPEDTALNTTEYRLNSDRAADFIVPASIAKMVEDR